MTITEGVKRDALLRSQQISGRVAYLDREIADLQTALKLKQEERLTLISLKSEYESSIPSPAAVVDAEADAEKNPKG
jgi:hypothetical protein